MFKAGVLVTERSDRGLGQAFDGLGIDVVRSAATASDTGCRTVTITDGREFRYDALIIATGAEVRRFAAPGRRGELVLRTLDDACLLRSRLETAASAIVVGAGFLCLAPPGDSELTADLVVTCEGETPSTDGLVGTGLADQMGVGSDRTCATVEPGVYAAGDGSPCAPTKPGWTGARRSVPMPSLRAGSPQPPPWPFRPRDRRKTTTSGPRLPGSGSVGGGTRPAHLETPRHPFDDRRVRHAQADQGTPSPGRSRIEAVREQLRCGSVVVGDQRAGHRCADGAFAPDRAGHCPDPRATRSDPASDRPARTRRRGTRARGSRLGEGGDRPQHGVDHGTGGRPDLT